RPGTAIPPGRAPPPGRRRTAVTQKPRTEPRRSRAGHRDRPFGPSPWPIWPERGPARDAAEPVSGFEDKAVASCTRVGEVGGGRQARAKGGPARRCDPPLSVTSGRGASAG